MKKLILFALSMFLMAFLLMLFTECSSRIENPVIASDSTFAFPSKQADGISANITLCKKYSKKTCKRIDTGTVFAIGEKESVYAFVDLENCFIHNSRILMFHIDWIDQNGSSFYQKRIDLSPTDSSTTLNSSISISPDKRQPGEYLIRIYLFRELIAEKKFELSPEPPKIPSVFGMIDAKITLCRNIDKKTGQPTDEDSIFTIKEKGVVCALISLEKNADLINRELNFKLDWTDAVGKSFYSKQIVISAADSSEMINSSISTSPDKRQPGIYFLRAYISDELIAEKKFEILPQPIVAKPQVKKMKAKIIFCRGVNSETGERIGVDSVFTIKEKEKVFAFIDLWNRKDFKDSELKFQIDWIGPNGKSLYRKQIEILPGDSSSAINSSISISPDKRQPGEYRLQVYFHKDQIAEKKFELH